MKLLFALLLTVFSSSLFAENEIPVYTESKTNILVTSSQPEFIIQLKSNPTTGFSWFLREYNSQFITPIKHMYQAPEKRKLVGAPGHEVWTFKLNPSAFSVPHQMVIRFTYARPWEKNVSTASSIVFGISTAQSSKP